MRQPPRGGANPVLRRPPKTLALVALVLALTGLVVVASRDRPIWSGLREETRNRPEIIVGVVVLCGLGVLLAAVIEFIAHRTILARRASWPPPPPLRATLLRSLPVTTAALAVASLLMIAYSDLGRGVQDGETPPYAVDLPGQSGIPLLLDWGGVLRLSIAPDGAENAEGEPPPDTDTPYTLLVITAVVMAIAGAIAWRSHGRKASIRETPDDDDAHDAPDGSAVHEALVDTIDAMLANPDPNTAIRGAYARLLEGLEACGRERRAHEGPMEHLHRVLTTLRVQPDPLEQLVELFELARFSVHPLEASHRDRALRALRDVASDLRHAERLPPAPARGQPLQARA